MSEADHSTALTVLCAQGVTILQHLDRINGKLDLLLSGPEKEVLSAVEAQEFYGCKSRSGFSRLCKKLGVRAFTKNHYRTAELRHAMMKARLADELAEEGTEGRVQRGGVNIHE